MTVNEIMKKASIPFEINDGELSRLFSFFLHCAPSVDSISAIQISNDEVERRWRKYRSTRPETLIKCYAYGYDKPISLTKIKLHGELKSNSSNSGIVCIRKPPVKMGRIKEGEGCCVLRHIRNSIAHGRVHIWTTGVKVYSVFQDVYNEKQNSIAILSKTDLKCLRKALIK